MHGQPDRAGQVWIVRRELARHRRRDADEAVDAIALLHLFDDVSFELVEEGINLHGALFWKQAAFLAYLRALHDILLLIADGFCLIGARNRRAVDGA